MTVREEPREISPCPSRAERLPDAAARESVVNSVLQDALGLGAPMKDVIVPVFSKRTGDLPVRESDPLFRRYVLDAPRDPNRTLRHLERDAVPGFDGPASLDHPNGNPGRSQSLKGAGPTVPIERVLSRGRKTNFG
jgi:hypothetical protein